MTADEMFERLGYKKYDNHPEFDEPIEKDMWTTQDCRQLYYEQKGTIGDDVESIEHIEFDTLHHNLLCYTKIWNRFGRIVPLNMKELKAINKKCEELGWLESEVEE